MLVVQSVATVFFCNVDSYMVPTTLISATPSAVRQATPGLHRHAAPLYASRTPISQPKSAGSSLSRLNSSRESIAVTFPDKNSAEGIKEHTRKSSVQEICLEGWWANLLERFSLGERRSWSDYTSAEKLRILPSGQPQIPVVQRVAKAVYEESLPWILSLTFSTALSAITRDTTPLLCLACAEILFLIYCTLKVVLFFNQPTSPQPLLQSREWEDIRNYLWESYQNTASRRSFVMGWFYDAPFERLRHEDALTFLAWMKFGVSLEHLTTSQIMELEGHELPELEQQVNHGRSLPNRKHYEEPLHCVRFNLEPLRYRHKPLLFYLVTHGAFHFVTHALKNYGFKYVVAKDPKRDIAYWCRQPPRHKKGGMSSKMNPPLVFVHGVGGLAFYYGLMVALLEKITKAGDNTPLILLDLPQVSLRMYDEIPRIKQQIESICHILDNEVEQSNGMSTKATFVGHSFGSIMSWMVQSCPD